MHNPKKLSVAILALKKDKEQNGEKEDMFSSEEDDYEDDYENNNNVVDGSLEDSLNSAIESVSEDLASAVEAGSKQGIKSAFMKLARIIKSAS